MFLRGVFLFSFISVLSLDVNAAPPFKYTALKSWECPLKILPLAEEDAVRLSRNQGSDLKAAERIRSRALPLPKNNQVLVLPEEMPLGGHYVSSPAELKSLKDGLYLYLVDVSGATFYAERVAPGATSEQFLNSHRSMLAYMKKVLGREPAIALGGEWEIANAKVSELNNKCGSFWSGKESLILSEEVLKEKGLTVEAGTQRIDHEKDYIPVAHHAEVLEFGSYVKLSSTPDSRLVLETLDHLTSRLSERFPAKVPGKGDAMEILNQNIGEMINSPTLFQSAQYLLYSQNPRERYGKLLYLVEQIGAKEVISNFNWMISRLK